jgi:predicted Na+-dependent transporter
MGYLKYTPYIYLIFALYFVYEAIVKWNDPDATPWLSVIAALAIFMFSLGESMRRRCKTVIANPSLWKLVS